MPLSWPEITERARYRRDERIPLIQKMVQVQTMYDGIWVLRVPGTENSLEEPIGPALVAEAIDNTALRCASTTPEIKCPPLDTAKHTGAGSIDFASRRRKALADAWRRAE